MARLIPFAFFALAALGGTLGALAFPNSWFSFFALLFPSLALLVALLRRSGEYRHPFSFAGGYAIAWATPFFAVQLYWASYPASSIVPWVALTIVEVLITLVWALTWQLVNMYLRNLHPIVRALADPLWFAWSWVGFEVLRTHVPFGGFPWSMLGFSQTDGPLLAWAPFGGTSLVAFICALTSYLCFQIFSLFSASRFISGTLLFTGVTALVFLPQILPSQLPSAVGSIHVAGVQGNVPGRGYDAFGPALSVIRNHGEVTEQLRGRSVDLLVWPENAVDAHLVTNKEVHDILSHSAQLTGGAPVIAGNLRGTDTIPRQVENLMFLWEDNAVTGEYVKSRPVPFGEYLPWRDFFTALYPPAGQMISTDMVAGTDAAVLSPYVPRLSEKVSVGVPICFEVADDAIIGKAVRHGAQILLFPTSNTFFDVSDQSIQQLAIARFRAAEFGRDAMQVSTMASSAAIDAEGKLTSQVLGIYESGIIYQDLSLRTDYTLATSLGNIPAMVGLGGWLLGVLAALAWRVKRR